MSFSSEPENPWSYVFLSFFRNNPAAIARDLKKRGRSELSWGNIALASFANTLFVMFLFNWRYVIFFFLPFFYLGHCFSYLNRYFRHYGADPDKPIALGRQQLRKDLQLDLFLRCLPCRASLPPEGALDKDGSLPSANRGAAETGRHAGD